MTTRLSSRILLAMLCLAPAIALPAPAQTLYANGPINGDSDAWTINYGFVVSDSFTISTGNSTVTGMTFGVWVQEGDQLGLTVEVSLTSNEFGGTTYFDQVVPFTTSDCGGNSYGYLICDATATFAGPTLPDGTYWVNLDNAHVPSGDPVYWDENSGHDCQSPGCPSQSSENSVGSIPSESFTILGTPSATSPELGTLALLASGALALGGFLKRR